jgi:hypothetical protein
VGECFQIFWRDPGEFALEWGTLMGNYPAEQRCSIRKDCGNLRRWILSRRPVNLLPFLLELGDLECSTLLANADEFRAIRENLTELRKRLGTAEDQ